jgi:hypothetical protein
VVTVAPFEHGEQARLALRAIVAEHGPAVLSRPLALSNLLSDLLPDSPKIARIFVAAAQDKIADELRQHAADGMDAETASDLAASSFARITMYPPEACAWVVGEFALALGLKAGPVTAVATAVLERAAVSTVTEPASAESLLAPSSAPLTGTAMTWTVVATCDRAYFDTVVAGRAPDAEPIAFPGQLPAQEFALTGPRLRIGRRSASRGLRPEIDLSGPAADPGISHMHAVLVAQDDGTWSVLDSGSANGTQVNGREIAAGDMTRLHDGDVICLGAWTRLTVRCERTRLPGPPGPRVP